MSWTRAVLVQLVRAWRKRQLTRGLRPNRRIGEKPGRAAGSPFEVLVFDLKDQRVRASEAGPEVDLMLKPGEFAAPGGKP